MKLPRILIIEDEKPAAEKLQRTILKYNSNLEISGPIDSIKSAVEYLNENLNEIDLIFLDIRLIDGESFSIFEQIEINKPVIFTTAYDTYALEAFKLNSIDYVLKPYTYSEIEKALNKYQKIYNDKTAINPQLPFDVSLLEKFIAQNQKHYKSRFMVKKGEKIKAIDVSEIKLFYADDRDVYLLANDNRRYSVNNKLEEVCELIDPSNFFRVNRTFLVQFSAIIEVIAYSNSRLKLDVGFKFDKDIIVSRDKVNSFKLWLEGDNE